MKELLFALIVMVLLAIIGRLYVENLDLKSKFVMKETTMKVLFLNSSYEGQISTPIKVDGVECKLVTRKFDGEWGNWIFNGENIIFSEYHKTKEKAFDDHIRIANGGVKSDGI